MSDAGLTSLDGRVQLKGLLGRGGMGEVHRAWDATLERPVAVKFLRAGDARETELLLLEARLQARVQHRHVVQVLEVGALAGRPCIVLQLVEGPSLAVLAPELDLASQVEVLRQAAEGLHAAHRQGLIHRDVKPGNVLVERPPEGGAPAAFVGDFGLAHDDEGGLTRAGAPAGTADFMSPEQVLSQAPLDHRTDVYSLGATLYAVLAGGAPFRHAAGEDPGSSLRRVLQEPPPPLPAEVPRDLARVVGRAMEKAPNDRYQSAQELAEDLARFQRGEPVLARAAPLGERVLRWSRRNPVAARALGLAALAIMAGGGVATWTMQRSAQAVLDAGRWAAEAQSLDQMMEMEKLLPVHDLRPAKAELRAALERARTARTHRSEGAASFLEGRAHQLLGEHDAALEALGRAWASGYRLPEVAFALAEAEAEQFRRERARIGGIADKTLAAAQLREAERRWRDPALARLAAQPGRGDVLGRLAQVLMASLEDRSREAGDLAHALASEAPRRVEALELGLAARRAEAQAVLRSGDLVEGRRLAEAAIAEGLAALAVARSSTSLRVTLGQLHLVFDIAGNSRSFLSHLGEAARLADELLALDGDSAPTLQLAAAVATYRARAHEDAGQPFLDDIERARDLAWRATQVDPSNTAAWDQLLWAALNGGLFLDYGGRDARRAIEQGLVAARRLRELNAAPISSYREAQLHVLKAELAHDRGERAPGEVARALELADEFKASARSPVAEPYLRSYALFSRARDASLAGGDPYPDLRAARAALGEIRARWPGDPQLTKRTITLLTDWGRLAIQEGRDDLPFDEGEPGGRALLEAGPGDATSRGLLGELRAFRGVFALQRGDRPRGERLYREGSAVVREFATGPLAPIAHRELTALAVARAWATRDPAHALEAEAEAREHLRIVPGSTLGLRLLASALLLRAELAAEDARGPLLTETLATLDAASAAGATGPMLLALRGRARERLSPGSGAADLAAARQLNPRLLLLKGL